jgi:hypothetical protein
MLCRTAPFVAQNMHASFWDYLFILVYAILWNADITIYHIVNQQPWPYGPIIQP